MFIAYVYRIMIGCPGDILEEVQTAKKVINWWTNQNAQRGRVLLPINWETNSYPEQGAHPQKILNKQVVEKSDMLIGIFGAKIGSPTDTAKSGTIEEIEEHINAGKPVMLFFRKFNDTSQTTSEELAKLESFKADIKNRCLYREYNTEQDFEKTFSVALELFLNDHWLDEVSLSSDTPTKTVEFSEEEVGILKEWTASSSPEAHSVVYKGGTAFFVGDSQFNVTEARELVKLKDFFNRLEQYGFIEQIRISRSGSPVYQLCVPAYDYVDSLNNQ